MATVTATSFLRDPRLLHAGETVVTFRYNSGATALADNDVILLAKLPWGTTLTGFTEAHTTGATARALDFGYDDSQSALVSGGAQATRNSEAQSAVGLQFTGSDDATQRYSILKAKVASGTATTSLKIAGNIKLTFGD